SRCSTTRNPSSSWCSTFPEKALRVCLGGTSTSSSAVPGVAHLRYAWTLGGLCRRAGARQPETLHRAGARRSRGRAFRVCLGGTSTGSSAMPGCTTPALSLDLGRGCVVERLLVKPHPFIALLLGVPGGGRSEFAWEGRAPARPRCRGLAPLRYAWFLGAAVLWSRCSTTRNPSSSWCSTFPGEGVQSLPGRDEHRLVRDAGVYHSRAKPGSWARLCRRAVARQTASIHRAVARRSRGRAFRVCLGGTSTSSSAVPGSSTPALRLVLGRGCVVESVLDNPKPFIELVLDVPGGGRSEFAWEGRA